MITWEDFEKIEMMTGTILTASIFEGARKPAFKLTIDFGPLGIKRSSAQITSLYTVKDLPGKQVVAVINFPPKQIANFYSECLVLGVYNADNNVVLLTPDKPVQNGVRLDSCKCQVTKAQRYSLISRLPIILNFLPGATVIFLPDATL